MTQGGEVVSGSITAPTAAEVAHRIEYLGLLPVETIVQEGVAAAARFDFSFLSRARPEDVTVFTSDLALLLKAGARINDALAVLAHDVDIGRLRPTVAKIRAAVLAGESFAEAISHHPALFPAMYVALVRVGEVSGTLDQVLEALGAERARADALRRRLADAARYPAFLLFAACGVLTFFLLFVLPQFATVLRDFNAKLDPVLVIFLGLSEFVRTHTDAIGLSLVALLAGSWLLLRQPRVRGAIVRSAARLPLINRVFGFHHTGLFCRNLAVLLGSGVALTSTLRILADMMAATSDSEVWAKAVDHVRHGGKLSDALANSVLPALAVRMLRLGEEAGQLPTLARRIADFYEAKLQRSLDRIVGVAGPLAIVSISVVVGGLIISIMTALLSVSQVIG